MGKCMMRCLQRRMHIDDVQQEHLEKGLSLDITELIPVHSWPVHQAPYLSQYGSRVPWHSSNEPFPRSTIPCLLGISILAHFSPMLSKQDCSADNLITFGQPSKQLQPGLCPTSSASQPRAPPSHPGSALWHFVCNGGTLPPDLKYGDESFWDTASAVQGGPRQNRDGLTCTSISTTSAYLKITRRTAHHIRSSGPGGASYGGCHF